MDEAADCFKKAYLADPQNLNALESLIELFIRSGKYEPAAALALQWTRSHPSCARAWIAWAKLNLLAGELASAKTALTRALKIDPANAAVQSALESLEGGTNGNSTPHSSVPLCSTERGALCTRLDPRQDRVHAEGVSVCVPEPPWPCSDKPVTKSTAVSSPLAQERKRSRVEC